MADEKKTVEILVKTTGDADLKRLSSSINGLRKEAAQSRKALGDMSKEMTHVGHSAQNMSQLMSFHSIMHGIEHLAHAFHAITEEMDGVLKGAQKIGVSTDDFQRLQYAAKLTELDMGKLEVAIVKLSKNMASLATKATPAGKILEQIGITAKTGTYDALVKISDLFKSMPDGAQKTALAVDLFGRAGASMIPMLNKGGEALAGWSKELDNMHGIIDGEALEAAEHFNETIIRMTTVLKKAESQLVAGMAPAFAEIAAAMQESISTGGADWKEFGEGLGEVAKLLFRLFSALAILFRSLGQRIGAIAASYNAFFHGNFIEAWNIQVESAKDSTESLKKAWDALVTDLPKPTHEGGHEGGHAGDDEAGKEAVARESAAAAAKSTMDALGESLRLQKDLTAAAKESEEAYRKVKEHAEAEADIAKIMVNYKAAGVEDLARQEEIVRAMVLAERAGKAEAEAALEATKKRTAELEKEAKARAAALKDANAMLDALRASVLAQQEMARASEISASMAENIKQMAEDEAEAQKIIAAFRKAGVKDLDAEARQVRELIALRREAKAEQDQHAKDQDDFTKTMEHQIELSQENVDKTVEIHTAWTDLMEAANLTEDTMKNSIRDFAGGLVDFFSGAEKSFGRFLKKFLAGMAQMIAQQLIYNAISSALFPAKAAAKGAIIDTPSALPSPGGPMNVQYAAKGMVSRSGIVVRPTMFAAGGTVGVMGEAGPEAIMPLKRGGDGKLGVAAPKSKVVIENHGPPVMASVEDGDGEMRIVLKAARLGADMAVSRVNQSVSSGYGSTSQSMQRTYGLKRRT